MHANIFQKCSGLLFGSMGNIFEQLLEEIEAFSAGESKEH